MKVLQRFAGAGVTVSNLRNLILYLVIYLGFAFPMVLNAQALFELPLPTIIEDCIVDLTGVPKIRLGIGVLVRTDSGEFRLGVSTYVGSRHGLTAMRMGMDLQFGDILWMGEMSYFIGEDGRIQIIEANETSGDSHAFRVTGIPIGNRRVRIENNVDNIPESFRASQFKGWHFGEGYDRMAKELQEIDGDVRHTIGNSLASISSFASALIDRRRSLEFRTELLNLYRPNENLRNHIALVEWLVGNLMSDGRISAGDISQVRKLLDMIANPLIGVEGFQNIDRIFLQVEILRLSELVSPGSFENIMLDIYAP